MTRTRRAWTAVFCALALTGAGLAPVAAADSTLADITGFRTTSLSIASIGCKDVPLTARVTEDPSVYWTSITTHIYRGDTETTYAFPVANRPDTWLWCPFLDGYGVFRVGPSDVTIYTDHGTYTAVDRTVAFVKIKARSTERITRAVRSGAFVTLTSRSAYFDKNRGGYTPWRRAKVAFQYRLTTSAAWRSASTVYTSSAGVATSRIRAPAARYWRAVLAEGAYTFGATSGQVRR